MIKNIWKICMPLGAALIILTMTSCEDWLNVSPSSEVRYDDQFNHKNGFKDQLSGIYSALCTESLYGANLTYGMVDALGQQYTWDVETGNYFHLWKFEYTSTTSKSIIDDTWNKMYNTIANVNILLKGINEYGDALSTEERAIYEGEAMALRAFLHFDVLRLFGKSYHAGADTKAIPYVTTISNIVTKLSTVSEALDLIISDLEKAKQLMVNDPIKTGTGNTPFLGGRTYHLNYYAACALLARAYLYKNDKAKALIQAKEVIDSNKFPWIKRENVTTSTRENRDGIFLTETIFMLNNMDLDQLTGKYLREGLSSDKSNLLVMKPEVLEEIYEKDQFGGYDWRLNYYFETQSETKIGSSKLWQFRAMPIIYKNKQPILRISEMYLIAAECEPNQSKAVEYFNTLRQNRGFDAGTNLTSDIADNIYTNEIEKEYHKEFIGEGQWFFYCKRMDKEELPNVTVPFSKDYYVLPMPDQEIEYGNRK